MSTTASDDNRTVISDNGSVEDSGSSNSIGKYTDYTPEQTGELKSLKRKIRKLKGALETCSAGQESNIKESIKLLKKDMKSKQHTYQLENESLLKEQEIQEIMARSKQIMENNQPTSNEIELNANEIETDTTNLMDEHQIISSAMESSDPFVMIRTRNVVEFVIEDLEFTELGFIGSMIVTELKPDLTEDIVEHFPGIEEMYDETANPTFGQWIGTVTVGHGHRDLHMQSSLQSRMRHKLSDRSCNQVSIRIGFEHKTDQSSKSLKLKITMRSGANQFIDRPFKVAIRLSGLLLNTDRTNASQYDRIIEFQG